MLRKSEVAKLAKPFLETVGGRTSSHPLTQLGCWQDFRVLLALRSWLKASASAAISFHPKRLCFGNACGTLRSSSFSSSTATPLFFQNRWPCFRFRCKPQVSPSVCRSLGSPQHSSPLSDRSDRRGDRGRLAAGPGTPWAEEAAPMRWAEVGGCRFL